MISTASRANRNALPWLSVSFALPKLELMTRKYFNFFIHNLSPLHAELTGTIPYLLAVDGTALVGLDESFVLVMPC
jgi:hypothetical protein